MLRLLIILLIPLSLLAKDATTVSDVSKGLMCTCGCTMVLYSCQCGTADTMTGNIQTMIDDGMTKEEILNSYVKNNGQAILAAPTKKGFNLSAWIMPFAMLTVAGFMILLLLKRWTGKSESISDESGENNTIEEPYLQALEQELEGIED